MSVAEDGVSKMWEMHKIVDQFYNGSAAGNGKFTISSFRFVPSILSHNTIIHGYYLLPADNEQHVRINDCMNVLYVCMQ